MAADQPKTDENDDDPIRRFRVKSRRGRSISKDEATNQTPGPQMSPLPIP
jgi:hypothetical protein